LDEIDNLSDISSDASLMEELLQETERDHYIEKKGDKKGGRIIRGDFGNKKNKLQTAPAVRKSHNDTK